MKIVKLIINLIIFILLLVLALDNKQVITINFYDIYTFNVPLIIGIVIFVFLGFIIGIVYNLTNIMKLKAQVFQLNRKIEKQETIKNNKQTDQII